MGRPPDAADARTCAVGQAIAVMHANLGSKLTVDDLADAVHLSRWHFSRVFAAVMGIPPARYLYRLRMAEACRLLTATDLPVVDVAVAVGYGDTVGTFSSRFKTFAGCPPVQYRRAAKRVAA